MIDEAHSHPEPVTASEPLCPNCGCEFGKSKEQYTRYVCDCGTAFEAERKIVFVSRMLEYRR